MYAHFVTETYNQKIGVLYSKLIEDSTTLRNMFEDCPPQTNNGVVLIDMSGTNINHQDLMIYVSFINKSTTIKQDFQTWMKLHEYFDSKAIVEYLSERNVLLREEVLSNVFNLDSKHRDLVINKILSFKNIEYLANKYNHKKKFSPIILNNDEYAFHMLATLVDIGIPTDVTKIIKSSGVSDKIQKYISQLSDKKSRFHPIIYFYCTVNNDDNEEMPDYIKNHTVWIKYMS